VICQCDQAVLPEAQGQGRPTVGLERMLRIHFQQHVMKFERCDLNKSVETDEYLQGNKLYGDNFSLEEIAAWFKDEEQGYFNLGAGNKEKYEYGYHALNLEYGFSFLPDKCFDKILGVGSAYGEELSPIVAKSKSVFILEPSDGFIVKNIRGVPVTYFQPLPSGILPFENDQIDLATCFGVLHHIPNVSTVMNEFYRCLKPDGHILIREPIISMGDWRKPRPGLTKRERGIPLKCFREIIVAAGFEIVNENKCMFPLTSRLKFFLNKPVYNSWFAIQVDRILCSLPIWAKNYHPRNIFHKLRPTSVFYVLRKPT
jgi:SAM-dependent methyltransferase